SISPALLLPATPSPSIHTLSLPDALPIFQLGLVPVLNASPAQSLILPVATLAIPIAAPLSQVLIRSIDDVTAQPFVAVARARGRSEEHTSELQSRFDLVCRLLLA